MLLPKLWNGRSIASKVQALSIVFLPLVYANCWMG